MQLIFSIRITTRHLCCNVVGLRFCERKNGVQRHLVQHLPAMACHETKRSWLILSIAFAGVAMLWLFNPGICGVGFSRSTIIARVDSTPAEESLLIGIPPWVPIAIKPERIASGVLSALRCNATCLDKVACEETEVKLCFWDQSFDRSWKLAFS